MSKNAAVHPEGGWQEQPPYSSEDSEDESDVENTHNTQMTEFALNNIYDAIDELDEIEKKKLTKSYTEEDDDDENDDDEDDDDDVEYNKNDGHVYSKTISSRDVFRQHQQKNTVQSKDCDIQALMLQHQREEDHAPRTWHRHHNEPQDRESMDRCSRIWGLLWHKRYKLRLPMPDSYLFCNGKFQCCLFTSKQSGEICRKNGILSNSEIIRAMVRQAKKDSFNVTAYIGTYVQADDCMFPVTAHALPSILRLLAHAAVKNDYISKSTSMQSQPQLYQWLRSYIHPLNGVRFITNYKQTRTSYAISTNVSLYSDQYVVDELHREYFNQSFDLNTDSTTKLRLHGVIVRECQRMTQVVVDYIAKVHNVLLKSIQCEFIQDFSKRIILHNILHSEVYDSEMYEKTSNDGYNTGVRPNKSESGSNSNVNSEWNKYNINNCTVARFQRMQKQAKQVQRRCRNSNENSHINSSNNRQSSTSKLPSQSQSNDRLYGRFEDNDRGDNFTILRSTEKKQSMKPRLNYRASIRER